MTRIGFLGLGRMGTPIARNLATAGFPVTLWNRTRAAADALAADIGTGNGAVVGVAGTAAEAAAAADVLISMVADDAAAEAVYLGEAGIVAGLAAGTVVVDMSTVAPATSVRLAEAVGRRGGGFVDAPVSGSTAAAESRKLIVMAGGEQAAVARVRPVLEAVAATVYHLGPVGAGAAMKLAVNSIVYGLTEALAEGLVLAERAGIDRLAAYEVIANSAVAAPVVHYRRAAFERPGEGPVSFRLALGVKDLRLITELAGRVGAPVPQAAINLELLDAAARDGFADADLAGVAEWLRRREQPTTSPGR
jgi:3-hydroxyisobutyrate dehydrogenase-like beta-hydroxyacid dehydrogenase